MFKVYLSRSRTASYDCPTTPYMRVRGRVKKPYRTFRNGWEHGKACSIFKAIIHVIHEKCTSFRNWSPKWCVISTVAMSEKMVCCSSAKNPQFPRIQHIPSRSLAEYCLDSGCTTPWRIFMATTKGLSPQKSATAMALGTSWNQGDLKVLVLVYYQVMWLKHVKTIILRSFQLSTSNFLGATLSTINFLGSTKLWTLHCASNQKFEQHRFLPGAWERKLQSTQLV